MDTMNQQRIPLPGMQGQGQPQMPMQNSTNPQDY